MLAGLLDHLLQSTLFAAVAGLLTLGLRENRAQTRYWLWLAASVKFLIPFSLLVDVGSHLGSRTAPPIAQPTLSSVIEQVSQPFAAPVPLLTVPAAGHPASADWIPAVLFAIWAIGFVALISAWWLGWRALRDALRTAAPLDLPIGMQVMTSAEFAEPGVFGVRRPILPLPAGIMAFLTPAQFEAILAHEQCHVRRRDNLATAIHMAVEALFWFHPLVWWLGARLMEERERACDEEVLLLGSEPQVYAEGILKICELYLESPLPCVSGVTGANLKKRIEAIMSNRRVHKLNFAKKAGLAAAGAAALAIPFVVGILNAPAIRAQSAQAAAQSSAGAKFEVASIKPCNVDPAPVPGKKSDRGGAGRITWSPGRLDVECRSVSNLIKYAYLSYADGKPWPPVARYDDRGLNPISPRLFGQPIKGSPTWLDSERYTIEAKADGPATREMMNGPMMQALLEERFQLKIHRETAETPVYELTVAAGGPKLQPSREGSCIDMRGPDFRDPGPGEPFPRVCGGFAPNKNGGVDFYGASMTALVRNLSVMFDRDVVDKTGLAGLFDFHFDTHPSEAAGDAPPPGDPGPPRPATSAEREERNAQLRSSLPKLGLKLEPAKGSGVFLVIDHVERPSAN